MKDYDIYIVAFSGGKDSTASFLHLLDIGIPREKIELWHHDIDGKGEHFMDWEVTPSYCKQFADSFGVPIYFSWREGGFEQEMLRKESATAPVWFEVPRDEWETSKLRKYSGTGSFYLKAGGDGPLGTRMKFPQVSADLSVRWCSAYLKIDVMTMAIRNQTRFNGKRTLVISGERAAESPARAKYKEFEPDRADLRDGRKISRVVDRWRAIKSWTEEEVWRVIKQHKVRVHPAYYLGWGRVSCKFCIFGNANQFASAIAVSPEQGWAIAEYEKMFGVTIKRNEDIRELAKKGTPYEGLRDNHLINIATSTKYKEDIFMDPWILPLGAYGESCGPV